MTLPHLLGPNLPWPGDCQMLVLFGRGAPWGLGWLAGLSLVGTPQNGLAFLSAKQSHAQFQAPIPRIEELFDIQEAEALLHPKRHSGHWCHRSQRRTHLGRDQGLVWFGGDKGSWPVRALFNPLSMACQFQYRTLAGMMRTASHGKAPDLLLASEAQFRKCP